MSLHCMAQKICKSAYPSGDGKNSDYVCDFPINDCKGNVEKLKYWINNLLFH